MLTGIMPLFDHLRSHSMSNAKRYHIPGHNGGSLYDIPFWRDLGRWDVTETYGMDDLHAPHSVIREAQELAARAFGSDTTHFLVNGTSSGILAAIHGLFDRNDTVLVQRNAHKSVYNGLALLGAQTQYIMPEIMNPGNIPGAVSPQTLAEALEKYPQAKGVILTSPTFYGTAADIRSIAELCKKSRVALIVDEAHGAHYGFHPHLQRKSAIYNGADIVIQSIHKTLPALTMGSMLHVCQSAKTKNINIEKLMYYLSVFQTTSPSYLVMASLDYARHWMSHKGQAALDHAYERKARFIDSLHEMGVCAWDRQWEKDGYGNDPLKLTISLGGTNRTGRLWEQILAEDQIFVELVGTDHVMLVLTFTDEISSDIRRADSNIVHPYDLRLLQCLAKNMKDLEGSYLQQRVNSGALETLPLDALQQDVIPEIAMPLAEAITKAYADASIVPLQQSVGRIAAEFIVPYPPGVPTLCPGERISASLIESLIKARQAGIRFQGAADSSLNTIKVI
ncbi:hypothetical protein BHU72_10975 [Desulfuribacillus stibiiarsenatis]|uniref:Uncharacterized protein n=1 Tax=Desulfuribacillus stibiiarsenatis TaxID=1390249 RepID=A0A1E5L2G9_9FIRM|nr:aminotransferase class I/II-fold pyridoxal phosphate-dependent enzyme [Desulfuribacillus stibiiarsenatis]OEH84320.1 hypothetical protein BHU72_10975 [Desulfuribacillus stibiiarsenatis]